MNTPIFLLDRWRLSAKIDTVYSWSWVFAHFPNATLHFWNVRTVYPLMLLHLLHLDYFYARKQLLLSACLSHRNSVRSSVRLSVTRVDQSKAVQARITKSSPSAVWKTLVSGTVQFFHKFEGGHPERRR